MRVQEERSRAGGREDFSDLVRVGGGWACFMECLAWAGWAAGDGCAMPCCGVWSCVGGAALVQAEWGVHGHGICGVTSQAACGTDPGIASIFLSF